MLVHPKTYFHTPSGPIIAKQLKIGDDVYACVDNRINVRIDKVRKLRSVVSEAVKLEYYKNIIAIVGNNSTSLTLDERRPEGNGKIQNIMDVRGHRKFARNVDIRAPLGQIKEPHAYSIGVLLGDGCKYGGNKIYLSGAVQSIVDAVANELGVISYKCEGYTHCLSNEAKGTSCHQTRQVECNHYINWIKNRYAHEKYVDLEIIKCWDRNSQISFLSGLLDSDGSNAEANGRVRFEIGMQAKSVIKAVQYCILALWNYWGNIHKDNRKKYKNGGVYSVGILNNFFTQKAFCELHPYGQNKTPSMQFGIKTAPNYAQITTSILGEEQMINVDLQDINSFFILANQGIILR